MLPKITVGITDCSKWKFYHDWFASDKIEIIKLSPEENNLKDVERCDGIVLSGGEDIHPKYYGKPGYLKRKKELKLEVNEKRDAFELNVLDKATKLRKPLLGICRGLQIANVYFGGTLIPDLSKKILIRHSKNEGYDQLHAVNTVPGTYLSRILRTEKGVINSAHHQAADAIGKGLRVCAKADDGTVEAIELKNQKSKPFFILVQWHPERMREQKSPFARLLKKRFLASLAEKEKKK